MTRYLTTALGLSILAAAYLATFGAPSAVGALIPTFAGQETAAAAERPPGAAPGGPRQGRGGATSVVMEPLAREPYEDTLRAIGTGRAWRSVDVTSSVSGEVTEVAFEPNRAVAAGDVLVRLDARVERLNLEIAEAEADQAARTLARYQSLREGGNLTITEVSLADAELAVRLAEANVGLAEAALDDRTIRAPIAGTPGLAEVEPGDRIDAGDLIVGIEDTAALRVEFELPERAVGLLSPGRAVLLGTPAYLGRVFEGEVIAFDSRVDAVTRSVTVQARVANPDGAFWSGMTFAIRLPDETEPLPVVPATAITWSRDGAAIWAGDGGVARRVPVTILHRSGEEVWIGTELPEGSPVITEGAQRLREGAAVEDMKAEASAGARGPGAEGRQTSGAEGRSRT